MRKITYLLLLPVLLSAFSCEEVVDIETGSIAPKLVVDASMKWYKGSHGNIQFIYLSKTTDYYSQFVPTVSNADVTVTSDGRNVFRFIENEANKGLYLCQNFIPVIGETYTLRIETDDKVYTATETLHPVPELTHTVQEHAGLMEGNRIIKAFFTDPAGTGNFYMQQYSKPEKRPQTAVLNDELTDGNETFTVRFFEELIPGEIINIELMGISERYYNYMSKIYATVSEVNVGPFQTPPAQIRGNIINRTDEDDYAFGYFRLSQVSTIQHISE